MSHTVLVVEDDTSVRIATKRLLTSMDITVISFENGVGVYEYLCAHSEVDLVLTDWEMPIKDGIALTREIRSNPQFSTLSIIMVSGKDDSSLAFRAGVDEYFRKGSKGNLLDVVMEFLE
jgi:CheY-like chemotaxis protein